MTDITEIVAEFARRYIAPRAELHTMEGFPFDLWGKMGEEGILGVGISEEFGGFGGNHATLSASGESLVRHGHNLGLAVSWLLHQMVGGFIMKFGTTDQHEKYLKELAAGRITACFAVSEPGRGGHPKYLAAAAVKRGDVYVLDGEKTYLTNGPIAGLFLVVAVTERAGDRKGFTAFIVPKDTPGLSLTEPIALPFLRPSPHGGIVLRGCAVPETDVVGDAGHAYDDMVLPFRELEDALIMGPIVGGIGSQLESLARLIREQDVIQTETLETDLGRLQSLMDTLRLIAQQEARLLDSGAGNRESVSLMLAFRSLTGEFQSHLAQIIARSGVTPDATLSNMTRDLTGTGQIAGNVARIKQRKLGAALLATADGDDQ
jgi:alkylation response protein AidB-like acyl-CoA dehydrogenase